jgi:23S rRNA pseudouridine2605 synthase
VFLPRRLDKLLHDTALFSVERARDAVAAGRVSAAGLVCDDHRRIVFEDDVVTVDGARVEPLRQHHHAMLNKPSGVTSTAVDPLGARDLSEYLAQMPRGAFPVGRLDRDTTGLLVFTTDGDLATALLRPEHATRKVYWLWLDGSVPDDDPRLKAFADGVPVASGTARATDVRGLARTETCTEVLVTLQTGTNRQIRRMCKAVGLHLVHLHRKSVGSLELGHLPLGAWRPLTDGEVEDLWRAAGGRGLVQQRQIAALVGRARAARAEGCPHARLETWLARHVTTGPA